MNFSDLFSKFGAFGKIVVGFMVIVFLMIIGQLLHLGYVAGTSDNLSFGINGLVEYRCIEGYKVTVDSYGVVHQMLSEFGKGIPCK